MDVVTGPSLQATHGAVRVIITTKREKMAVDFFFYIRNGAPKNLRIYRGEISLGDAALG